MSHHLGKYKLVLTTYFVTLFTAIGMGDKAEIICVQPGFVILCVTYSEIYYYDYDKAEINVSIWSDSNPDKVFEFNF